MLSGPETRAVPNAETLGARWIDVSGRSAEPGDPVAEVSLEGELGRLVRRGVAVAAQLRDAGLLG